MDTVMLDYEDFKCLVRGGILTIKNLNLDIALRDIGFEMMDQAITSADIGVDTYKNRIQGE